MILSFRLGVRGYCRALSTLCMAWIENNVVTRLKMLLAMNGFIGGVVDLVKFYGTVGLSNIGVYERKSRKEILLQKYVYLFIYFFACLFTH